MRFAIDILHPAHVHFFRNFISAMKARGHQSLITAREKECTLQLLDAYNLKHYVLSRQYRGPGLASELIIRTVRLWRQAQGFRPDYLLGIMGPSIALAGQFLPSKTVVFYDTEMAKATNWFAYPMADYICTPQCYQEKLGKRHHRYPGYHELAYLHPNRFVPDPFVLRRYQLPADRPIFVVRFVSWSASHDIIGGGISMEGKRQIVETLSGHGKVLISSEGELPRGLRPYRLSLPFQEMHHLLAAATLLVGESATMASEAAVLGTHAVYLSRKGRGYTEQQEHRYGLVHNFRLNQEKEALRRIEELLSISDLKRDGALRRQKLLNDHIDVTDWMVEFFEKRLKDKG